MQLQVCVQVQVTCNLKRKNAKVCKIMQSYEKSKKKCEKVYQKYASGYVQCNVFRNIQAKIQSFW